MRWFRRRGKDADQSPPGAADFSAGPDVFAAPMAEGFEESFGSGVCDICGTTGTVFRCSVCKHEGVQRPVHACLACWQGPIWAGVDSHAATQHLLRRHVFHAISMKIDTRDFLTAEVQKSLLAESASITHNDADAGAITAMAEPRVEYHIEAVSEAAGQAIYEARNSAHRAVAAFREGRTGQPGEEIGQHAVNPSPDYYAAVTDAFKAPMAEGFVDRQRTEPDSHKPPDRTAPDPVAAVCELCGSNGDNGWVAICGLCKGEGAIPPLQVCNVCWGTRAIIEPHVVTNHPNNRHIYHAVTVQYIMGFWLWEQVRASLRMECAMFTENDEDANRCIEMAAPSVVSHVNAAADAAAKAITEARNAVHEVAGTVSSKGR